MTLKVRVTDRKKTDNITESAKAAQVKARSIEVDGVSYKIPRFLADATDEEITRTIRGWRPNDR